KTGVTMADVNGDGWLDIYVCYSGKGNEADRRNELYINNRDLTFSEKAKEYGLDDAGCSTQAVFFDYDKDDDLDCYVLNHNIKAYKNFDLHYLKTEYDPLAADRLYRNDNGHFTDISSKAGISGNPVSFGLGVAVSDINNDGWPDIFVANDYTEQDYCYINNKDGSFSSKEHYMFTHLSQFSMGCDIADINNDGLVDIFTLDMLPPDNRRQKLLLAQENYELYQGMAENGFHYQFMRNMLHLNNGNGTFSEIGQLAGISNTDWSWAPLIADFDNDGQKDMFVTTGYMRDYTNKDFLKYWGDYLIKQAVNRDSINYLDIIKLMPVTLLPNYAFKNNGDLSFRDVSARWGLNQAQLSNGAAYGDLDNDGDLDIVVNNINATAGIYKNILLNEGIAGSLSIRLKGLGKNTTGTGAKLWCYTNGGVQFLEQMPARGYQSSVSETLHFGLGKHTQADSLVVQWLNGNTQSFYNLKANQVLSIQQDEKPLSQTVSAQGTVKKIFNHTEPVLSYSHQQLEYNDFKRQPLMPSMLSYVGPRIAIGDLNNDGLEDIFIGSDQGKSSELLLQQPGGKFVKQAVPAFLADSISVTTSILLFDADGDRDMDIYCSSGGYNDFFPMDERMQDRLFINRGDANFFLSAASLPAMYSCKSAAVAADLDGDGDTDIFIGGRTVPGSYPEAAPSYILLNDGKGKFSDAKASWLKDLPAMRITAVAVNDWNKDNKPDLLLAGEWMHLTLLLNTGTGFKPADAGLAQTSGLWNTIRLFDADNDGDSDLIAGNWGLNSQLKAAEKEPMEMLWLDVDKNGSVDPFLCYYINGSSYPYISRDELLDQAYLFRKKFTSYECYANAKLSDMLSPQDLSAAQKINATTLETTFFENTGKAFVKKALPVEAQFSPVYKIVDRDLNKDGLIDMILFGNNDHPRLKIGKMDANFGTVLINRGNNEFSYAGTAETGIAIAGDVRDAVFIQTKNGPYLLVGVNNNDCLTFKLNE
ncbi:MAG: VCBS repeat-containing protein, partial [Bacteroidota bacterium]